MPLKKRFISNNNDNNNDNFKIKEFRMANETLVLIQDIVVE